jgi:hypothetical protein
MAGTHSSKRPGPHASKSEVKAWLVRERAADVVGLAMEIASEMAKVSGRKVVGPRRIRAVAQICLIIHDCSPERLHHDYVELIARVRRLNDTAVAATPSFATGEGSQP